MNFTILGPSENQLAENKSDMVDGNFGGNREVTDDLATSQDYKRPRGGAPNRKENPVDDTTKDIDDMTDLKARKREFSRREETSNVQKSNKDNFFVKSDVENQPDEETDAFEPDPTDPNFLIKNRRSKSKGHFGSGQYDNMPNRGNYEGEIS
jgi:hypothetical protein